MIFPRRFTRVMLLFAVVLISACNLPSDTPTPTAKPGLEANPTQADVEAVATSEPESVPDTISAGELGVVLDLAIDPPGNVWAATSKGAAKCNPALESCELFTVADGLADNDVRAVEVAPSGTLWFGTSLGLSSLTAESWTTYMKEDGIVGETVFDLSMDASGGLWVGTNQGVSHFENETWTNYSTDDGLIDNYVYCIFEANDGAIWFGTSMGASRFDGANWTAYDQDYGLPASDVLSIAEDSDGALWFGTLFGGAARFDGSEWRTYDFPGEMEANVVQAITLDGEGALWFGTRMGAFRFDGDTWSAYTTAEGLMGLDVRAVVIAGDGTAYLGTNAGVSRIVPSEKGIVVVVNPVDDSSEGGHPEGEIIAHLAVGEEVEIHAIHMIDADRGWAIGGLGNRADHVLRTADSGTTWRDVTPPEPVHDPASEHMATGFFLDKAIGWVLYHSVSRESGMETTEFAVWRTEDGGDSWQQSGPIRADFVGSEFNPPYVRFSDSVHGWILARLGGVGMHKYPVYFYATADGGALWQRRIDPYESVYLQSCTKTGMAFAGEQTGWLTIGNCPITGAQVVVTVDDGITWEEIALPAPDEQPDLFDSASCESHSPTLFSSSQGALAISCLRWEDEERIMDHYVYTSEDAGGTWQTHRYPGGALLFLNANDAWALARDIHVTHDGGQTWSKVKTVSWDGQFSFVSQQLGWAVARDEDEIALVRTKNGGQSWTLLETTIASE